MPCGRVVDIVELPLPDWVSQSLCSSAAILAWTACCTKFIQMSCADTSALTRAQFHPRLEAALL